MSLTKNDVREVVIEVVQGVMIDNIIPHFEQIHHRIDLLDNKVDRLDHRLSIVESDLKEVKSDVKQIIKVTDQHSIDIMQLRALTATR